MTVLKQVTLLIVALFVMQIPTVAQNYDYAIIPAPKSLKASRGVFEFKNTTKIYFANTSKEQVNEAFDVLCQRMSDVSEINLEFTNLLPESDVIVCRINKNIQHKEGYTLHITPSKIEIEANSPNGIFYATQTIRQLLPPAIESKEKVTGIEWVVPCCKIVDAPMFAYRGMHLDVCRHFVPLDEVKAYIDQMALLKLNTFHWHLTDDQGWMIEIKKYPRLAGVGGFRERTLVGHLYDSPRKWDNTRTGGYFTQEEIKEVINYAQKRSITVIPEIELPGHAMAALTAYPQYSCSGGPFDVQGTWGVFNDVYCSKEETFSFLEDILDEVADLFPGEYIHIGGDECPKIRWKHCAACQLRIKEEGLKDEHELQSYFIRRMQKHLAQKNKRIIGWDEILEGGLAPGATVMTWRGVEGGIAAAKHGNNVIMTPYEHLYLDYYQSQSPSDPLAIGGYLPIKKVYEFDPYPSELSTSEMKHIWGVQANLWTEYLASREQREFMLFPRLAALSELTWTEPGKKNYKRFSNNLPMLLEGYDYAGLNYSKAFFGIESKPISDGKGNLNLKLNCDAPQTTIYYTLDGSKPNVNSTVYISPIPLPENETIVKAITVRDGRIMNSYKQLFIKNKAAGQVYTVFDSKGNDLKHRLSPFLFDRRLGEESMERRDWFTWQDGDLTIDIDFQQPVAISNILVGSANQKHRTIYPPASIEYQISEDGVSFRTIGILNFDEIVTMNGKANMRFASTTISKIRLKINILSAVPEHDESPGASARLFIDEIIIE